MADQNGRVWRSKYMESCNCDYLCPCIYTNPQAAVTYDHCTAALVFRIDGENYGDTKLDGLKFALIIRSGKIMADGNWIFAGVVDEAADEAQRRALMAIVSGVAGGPPAFIRAKSGLRFSWHRVQADRVRAGRVDPARPRSPMFCPSKSKGWRHATAAASRSTSTTLRIRRGGGSPWPAPKSCTCMALASSSISSARAIMAISRRFLGLHKRRRSRLTIDNSRRAGIDAAGPSLPSIPAGVSRAAAATIGAPPGA